MNHLKAVIIPHFDIENKRIQKVMKALRFILTKVIDYETNTFGDDSD